MTEGKMEEAINRTNRWSSRGRKLTAGAVEDASRKGKKRLKDEWLTKPRWVMKARWRRRLSSITGTSQPHHLPPSFLSEPPSLPPRGTTPALHLCFISSDHIHAAWRWKWRGSEESLEPAKQQEMSNPQPLVSQVSNKSNWIGINVGARLPQFKVIKEISTLFFWLLSVRML